MARSGFRLKQSRRARIASWLVRHFVFPVWIRRDHPKCLTYAREFERTQFLPKAELEALQLQRLRKLLQYAQDHCQFYAQRLEQAGIVPEKLASLEQFSRLPALTKRDIQDHAVDLQARDFPKEKRKKNQTGG